MNTILLEVKDKVGIITINRPEKRNALNQQVRSQLFEVVKDVNSRDDIRVLVITGAGDSFVAGADVAAMKGYGPQDAETASRHGSEIFSFIENMRIPVIAAVNGWALGAGCELALACDMRICSDNARFGQPEVRLGIIPGYGANVRLPRLIGTGRAKEMIFTGSLMDAAEAKRIGLVNDVVPREKLMERVMALALSISGAGVAIHFVKQAVNMSFDQDKNKAMEFSSRLYGDLYKTHDCKEGISAYLEKRDPNFKGK